MENTQTGNLYAELPDDMLTTMKAQFASNPKVVEMIDGILEGRAKVAQAEQIKVDFESTLENFNLPKPPAGILNVMYRWAEIDVDDTSQPAETVEVIDSPAVAKTDSTPAVKAVIHEEQRYPQVKDWRWVKTVNFAQQIGSGKGTGDDKAPRKLAISISKVANDGTTLTPIGNFRTGKEACKYLELDNGVSSANFYLQNHGYIVKTGYDGTDFTVKA